MINTGIIVFNGSTQTPPQRTLYKKPMTSLQLVQPLHFLSKLRSFNVDQTTLTLFDRSFLFRVYLTFSIIYWCGNLSVSGKKKLQKLVNICSRITGQQQPSLANVYDR